MKENYKILLNFLICLDKIDSDLEFIFYKTYLDNNKVRKFLSDLDKLDKNTEVALFTFIKDKKILNTSQINKLAELMMFTFDLRNLVWDYIEVKRVKNLLLSNNRYKGKLQAKGILNTFVSNKVIDLYKGHFYVYSLTSFNWDAEIEGFLIYAFGLFLKARSDEIYEILNSSTGATAKNNFEEPAPVEEISEKGDISSCTDVQELMTNISRASSILYFMPRADTISLCYDLLSRELDRNRKDFVKESNIPLKFSREWLCRNDKEIKVEYFESRINANAELYLKKIEFYLRNEKRKGREEFYLEKLLADLMYIKKNVTVHKSQFSNNVTKTPKGLIYNDDNLTIIDKFKIVILGVYSAHKLVSYIKEFDLNPWLFYPESEYKFIYMSSFTNLKDLYKGLKIYVKNLDKFKTYHYLKSDKVKMSLDKGVSFVHKTENFLSHDDFLNAKRVFNDEISLLADKSGFCNKLLKSYDISIIYSKEFKALATQRNAKSIISLVLKGLGDLGVIADIPEIQDCIEVALKGTKFENRTKELQNLTEELLNEVKESNVAITLNAMLAHRFLSLSRPSFGLILNKCKIKFDSSGNFEPINYSSIIKLNEIYENIKRVYLKIDEYGTLLEKYYEGIQDSEISESLSKGSNYDFTILKNNSQTLFILKNKGKLKYNFSSVDNLVTSALGTKDEDIVDIIRCLGRAKITNKDSSEFYTDNFYITCIKQALDYLNNLTDKMTSDLPFIPRAYPGEKLVNELKTKIRGKVLPLNYDKYGLQLDDYGNHIIVNKKFLTF